MNWYRRFWEFCGHAFIVYAFCVSLINASLTSAVTVTSKKRSGLTQCADNFHPKFKASERSKSFLQLVSLYLSGKTDALEKYTPNQRLSVRVPATSPVHYGSILLVFNMFFWHKREFKSSVFQHCSSYTHFPQMKRSDANADKSSGSQQGLPDPCPCGFLHQTNHCHGIIVLK